MARPPLLACYAPRDPRPAAMRHSLLELADCTIDLGTRVATRADGDTVSLSEMESKLVQRLAATPGVAVSRRELLTDVWAYHPDVVSRAPDVAIRRLRKKIEPDDRNPTMVQTVKGGWMLADARLSHGSRPRTGHDLVGRDADLAAIDALLASEPVVGVTGPPGVGKTALVRVALADLPHRRVPLSGDLLPALADALQLDGDADLEAVARVLRARPGVVWFDGLEAPEDLASLCAASPQTRWVWTARSRGPGRVHALTPLGTDDAVALFRARAGAWEESVDAATVAALVDALDGLPLAVELAAARVGLVGVAALLDEHGVRHERLAERGAALHQAVSASWQLLPEASRRVLAQVSLLDGPFDWSVASALGEVADALDALQRASLLAVRQTADGPEYEVLASVRWFAAARAEPEDLAVVARWALGLRGLAAHRHRQLLLGVQRRQPTQARLAVHVLRVLSTALPAQTRRRIASEAEAEDGQERRLLALELARLDWETGVPGITDTLARIVDEALGAGDRITHAAACLWLSVARRGDEGVTVDDALLAYPLRSPDASVRIDAEREMARRHAERGAFEEAAHHLRRALVIDGRSGTDQRPTLLVGLGRLAMDAGRPEDGLASLEEALAAPYLPDRLRERALRSYGGLLLFSGAFDRAVAAMEEALGLQRRLGLEGEAAATLGNLGAAMAELGDPRQGRAFVQEALATQEVLGRPRSVATTLVNLGILDLLDGASDAARRHARRSRQMSAEGGWRPVGIHARYVEVLADALEGRAEPRAMAQVRADFEAIGSPYAEHAAAYLVAWGETASPARAEVLAALRGERDDGDVDVRIAVRVREAEPR